MAWTTRGRRPRRTPTSPTPSSSGCATPTAAGRPWTPRRTSPPTGSCTPMVDYEHTETALPDARRAGRPGADQVPGAAHRPRHRPAADDGQGPAGGGGAGAVDLHARGRLGAGVRPPQRPVAGSTTPTTSCGRRPRSSTPSTGTTSTTATSPTTAPRGCRAGRRAPTSTCRGGGARRYDWRGFEPFAAHPHVVEPRPGLHRQLEQQAGARLRLLLAGLGRRARSTAA